MSSTLFNLVSTLLTAFAATFIAVIVFIPISWVWTMLGLPMWVLLLLFVGAGVLVAHEIKVAHLDD